MMMKAVSDRARQWRARCRTGAASLVWVVAMSPFAESAAAQFTVAPTSVQLGGAMERESTVLQVVNEGDRELQFRFYGADFDQAANGEHTFHPLGRHPGSCGDRISVLPDAATLRPGESQQLRVTLEAGATACWAIVFAESAAFEDGGIRIGQRIGAKVYGVPAGAAREAEIEQVQASWNAGSLEVALGFRNDGNAPLRVSGRVEIRTLEGETLARVPVESFGALPGARRVVRSRSSQPLPPGTYLAVPILDFGGAYLAAGQALFEIGGAP